LKTQFLTGFSVRRLPGHAADDEKQGRDEQQQDCETDSQNISCATAVSNHDLRKRENRNGNGRGSGRERSDDYGPMHPIAGPSCHDSSETGKAGDEEDSKRESGAPKEFFRFVNIFWDGVT
jgi:hypothetical protein